MLYLIICYLESTDMWKSIKSEHFARIVILLLELLNTETLKYWVGVQWGQSHLMGRRCLFSLGCPSCDGVMIKMPYWVDVLHRPALHTSPFNEYFAHG